MPKLTNYLPSVSFNTSDVKIPSEIEFLDPFFNKPQKIDMTIVSEIFCDLICKDQLRPDFGGPTF